MVNKLETQEFMTKRSLLYPGYPEQPPFEAEESENIFWHYDETKDFGCWVMNDYGRPLALPRDIEQAICSPEHHLKYKSPLPLHKANVPNSWRAHMLWYVDEQGFGQYTYYTRTKQDDGSFEGEFLYMTVLPK